MRIADACGLDALLEEERGETTLLCEVVNAQLLDTELKDQFETGKRLHRRKYWRCGLEPCVTAATVLQRLGPHVGEDVLLRKPAGVERAHGLGEPRFPALIEVESLDQILLCFIQDLNSHESLSRISALAVSQSMNRDFPSVSRRRRSSRISLCQAGDSIASGVRESSSQSDSMTASFSWRVISFRGRLIDMDSVYPSTDRYLPEQPSP